MGQDGRLLLTSGDVKVKMNSHTWVMRTSAFGMKKSQTPTLWRMAHTGKSRTLGEMTGATMDSPTFSTLCLMSTQNSLKELVRCSDIDLSMSRLNSRQRSEIWDSAESNNSAIHVSILQKSLNSK